MGEAQGMGRRKKASQGLATATPESYPNSSGVYLNPEDGFRNLRNQEAVPGRLGLERPHRRIVRCPRGIELVKEAT
jgi:hypothetical protein